MPGQVQRYNNGRRAFMVGVTAGRLAVSSYQRYKENKRRQQSNRSNAVRVISSGSSQDHGTDTTYSSFRRGYKRSRGRKSGVPRGFHKVFAVQRINSLSDTTIVGLRNQQSVAMLNQFSVNPGAFSPYIYMGGSTNTPRDMLQSDLMLRLLDSAYSGPLVVGQDLTLQRKWMSLGVRVKHRIKNQHNFPVKVTLYDVVARRDLTDEAQTPQLGDEEPITLWTRGIQAKNVNALNLLHASFPGSTPYQSEIFCKFWTIGKRTTFMLHPGSEHHHFVAVKPHYMFNVSDWRGLQAKRGLTTGVMCVLEGGIGTDTLLGGEAQLSAGKLAVVSTYSHKFQAYERSRPTMQQFMGLTEGEQPIRAVLEDSDIVDEAENA